MFGKFEPGMPFYNNDTEIWYDCNTYKEETNYEEDEGLTYKRYPQNIPISSDETILYMRDPNNAYVVEKENEEINSSHSNYKAHRDSHLQCSPELMYDSDSSEIWYDALENEDETRERELHSNFSNNSTSSKCFENITFTTLSNSNACEILSLSKKEENEQSRKEINTNRELHSHTTNEGRFDGLKKENSKDRRHERKRKASDIKTDISTRRVIRNVDDIFCLTSQSDQSTSKVSIGSCNLDWSILSKNEEEIVNKSIRTNLDAASIKVCRVQGIKSPADNQIEINDHDWHNDETHVKELFQESKTQNAINHETSVKHSYIEESFGTEYSFENSFNQRAVPVRLEPHYFDTLSSTIQLSRISDEQNTSGSSANCNNEMSLQASSLTSNHLSNSKSSDAKPIVLDLSVFRNEERISEGTNESPIETISSSANTHSSLKPSHAVPVDLDSSFFRNDQEISESQTQRTNEMPIQTIFSSANAHSTETPRAVPIVLDPIAFQNGKSTLESSSQRITETSMKATSSSSSSHLTTVNSYDFRNRQSTYVSSSNISTDGDHYQAMQEHSTSSMASRNSACLDQKDRNKPNSGGKPIASISPILKDLGKREKRRDH